MSPLDQLGSKKWPSDIAFYLNMTKTRYISGDQLVNQVPIIVQDDFINSLGPVVKNSELSTESAKFFLVSDNRERTRYLLEVVMEEGEWEPSKLHLVENLPTLK